jgi:putative restriction endonuclease
MTQYPAAQPDGRRFAEIAGYPAGTWFPNRAALAAAGIHPPLMAGISGWATDGADSIVLSGGYEDDLDIGDAIVYTGHGGNDPETGKQIADQTLTKQNQALAVSCREGLPVRVTRGARHRSDYSPPTGFQYDGLYRVDAFWSEHGQSGSLIWRFRLERLGGEVTTLPVVAPEGVATPRRQEITTQRVVRSSAVAQYVKQLHDHHCQICGVRLETGAGAYSEAAHIRPLGQPHNGPDVAANLLCLCPNHHLLYDLGGIVITSTFAIVAFGSNQVVGTLRRHPSHSLDTEALAYHRALFGGMAAGA